MAVLTGWPCGRSRLDVSIQPAIRAGSIFNCGRMVMLGGVVLVVSVAARFLIVMIPPITRSQKEPRGPAPPCGASSRHS